jgi:acyl-coenzyme A synthetase/AMP-(fatty) acid ligase
MVDEQLVLVIHLEAGQDLTDELRSKIVERNFKLLNYKRVHGLVLFGEDFPRNASQKLLRETLKDRLADLDRATAIQPL